MSDESDFSIVVFQQNTDLINFKIHQESQEIWATLKEIAALYGVDETTVSRHIANIYSDEELNEQATTAKYAVVQNEGNRTVRRVLTHYSLDVIISVGYRVNAKQAIAFRQWSTNTLKTYLEQGYLINEKALRDSPEKVNELAAKVREIRSGEKQVYAKVRDCFKISASDYDPSSREVRMFYMLLQDKFHHAITGMTSSKLILDRANHLEDNMGLYNIAGTFPTKKEIEIGKNYLRPEELYRLHLLSEQFLLYAEATALKGKEMTMSSLHKQLDRVLILNDYDVFSGYADYIKDEAIDHARQEFERYKKKKVIEDNGYIYDEEMAAAGEFDFLFED
ncbi:TPA: virulence RhuM family protein [Proteus mirabilis]|uniref:RhuM family protein n=1 Tax=Proteus mirabilis TaxID=584 RepID=UPI001628F95B|nr:RhuM family protein [Proteus mirabilis]MBB6658693.1 virulence RhuM family protein [Proteus mirabilis]HEK1928030.1 virulence RhuM family protein [Proteus mirabilis]